MLYYRVKRPQIAKFIGPSWGTTGSCRPQMGPMLVPWTLLSGALLCRKCQLTIHSSWCVAPRHKTSNLTHCGLVAPHGAVKLGLHCIRKWVFDAISFHEPMVTYYQLYPFGTNFSEVWIKIHQFLFKDMRMKMLSAKCGPLFSGFSASIKYSFILWNIF